VDGKAREDKAMDEDGTKDPNQQTGSAWPTPPHTLSRLPPGQASDDKDATADGKAHEGEGATAGGKAREDEATGADETMGPS